MRYDPDEIGVEVEHERRKVLVAHGYTPLPLSTGFPGKDQSDTDLLNSKGLLGSKAVTLKDWTQIDFSKMSDPEVQQTLLAWRSHGNSFLGEKVLSKTTGIRSTPELCFIDIDVDDDDMVWAILDFLKDTHGAAWFSDSIIRCTNGSYKVCLICGIDGAIHAASKGATPKFGCPDDKIMGAVEVFHGGGQAGVSGVHSYGPRDVEMMGFFTLPREFEPAITYRYFDGPTPFDTSVDQLPKLKAKDVKTLVTDIGTFFDEMGWHRLKIDSGGAHGGKLSFDLDTSITFESDEGPHAYSQLVERMNVRMLEIVGEGKKHRRGWTWEYERETAETFIAIYDREHQVSYLPQEARPLTAEERLSERHKKFNASTVDLSTKLKAIDGVNPRTTRRQG